jgi:tellurite resistance protein TerC
METIGTPLLWTGFAVFVLLALAVDFGLLKKKGPHEVGMREALGWSAAWVALALVFNAVLWLWLSQRMPSAEATRIATEFLTGYVVEKSLAVDNIFVFLLLFSYFQVPAASQARVLSCGVLGAIVLRGILIVVGAALLARFHWLLYLFGFFLLATGAKMFWAAGQPPDIGRNPVLHWLQRHLPLTPGHHGEALWVGNGRARRFTPLFLVLVMIGIIDVVFAVDSIPAIFAITTDPFIVLTSNVFAVLGLRALYFMLAGMAGRFHLLSYGLASVLVFVGSKMLLADLLKLPVLVSLAVVVLLIGGSIAASLWLPPKPGHERAS